jgi:hypothetical protein
MTYGMKIARAETERSERNYEAVKSDRTFSTVVKVGIIVALIVGAAFMAGMAPVAENAWPAWVQKVQTINAEEGTPVKTQKWAMELWHATLGDTTLFFTVRPVALRNNTFRLSPYVNAPKNEMWWVDYPNDGSVIIRRTVLADFGD